MSFEKAASRVPSTGYTQETGAAGISSHGTRPGTQSSPMEQEGSRGTRKSSSGRRPRPPLPGPMHLRSSTVVTITHVHTCTYIHTHTSPGDLRQRHRARPWLLPRGPALPGAQCPPHENHVLAARNTSWWFVPAVLTWQSPDTPLHPPDHEFHGARERCFPHPLQTWH